MDEGTGQRAGGEGFAAGDGEEGQDTPATEENEEHTLERHPVSVLIRDEDVGKILAHSWMHIPSGASEEAAGHGWKFKAGEFHQGKEGQVYVMSVEHEDGEAHMSRGSFLRWMDPHDTEGEGVGAALLYPASNDDLEAQGFKAGVLKPDLSGSWTLALDD